MPEKIDFTNQQRERIRQLRASAGLTYQELAKLNNCSESTIRKVCEEPEEPKLSDDPLVDMFAKVVAATVAQELKDSNSDLSKAMASKAKASAVVTKATDAEVADAINKTVEGYRNG